MLKYKSYPKFVYSFRFFAFKVLAKSRLLEKFLLGILSIFKFSIKIHMFIKYVKRSVGLIRYIKKDSIAIQCGASADTENGHVIQISKLLSKKGTLIVIEPDIRNIKNLKKQIIKKKIAGKVLFVNKAVSNKKSSTEMYLGVNTSQNIVHNKKSKSYQSWIQNSKIFGIAKTKVQLDKIDDILTELKISKKNVNYLNLTINGSEYYALDGCHELLKNADKLLVTAIAGRDKEVKGKKELGYIKGVKDYIAMKKILNKYGYYTRFIRFHPKTFGYIIGSKNKKNDFMK